VRTGLELQKLEDRRQRGELIQFFKIYKGQEEVKWEKSLLMGPPRAGRRAQFRREIVKSCSQRHNFFSNKTINAWNELPDGLVGVGNVCEFKKGLDEWRNE